jgi:pyruvate kinase
VALSFVQRPQDISEARRSSAIAPRIVCKLEKPRPSSSWTRSSPVTDAVMVARGDLGVELPAERVPAIQKRVVRCRRRLGKAGDRRDADAGVDDPTARAHARRGSDVANGRLRRADAVMLVGEVPSGRHPVEAVRDDGPHPSRR